MLTQCLRTVRILGCCLLVATTLRAQTGVHKLLSPGAGTCSHLQLAAAPDGAALLAYHYTGTTGSALVVQRVDTSGQTVWSKTYVQAVGGYVPVSAAATPDGGLLTVLMDTVSLNGLQVLKTIAGGSLQWSRSFPARYPGSYPVPLLVLPDGGFYCVHTSRDSFFLKRLDAGGNLIRERSYDAPGGSTILPTSLLYQAGSLYIGGYDNDSYTSFLAKTDTSGNIAWQHNQTGDISVGIHLAAAGTRLFLSTVPTHKHDTKLAIADTSGAIAWAAALPALDPQLFRMGPNSLGLCYSDDTAVRLVLLDTLGTITGGRSYHDGLAGTRVSAAAIPAGGCWVAGANANHIWLMKADAQGNTACFQQLFSPVLQPHTLMPGNMQLTVRPAATAMAPAAFTVQQIASSDSVLCGGLSVLAAGSGEELSIGPNPVGATLTIRQAADLPYRQAVVVDSRGRTVLCTAITEPRTVMAAGSWPAGIYLLQLRDNRGRVITRKIIRQ